MLKRTKLAFHWLINALISVEAAQLKTSFRLNFYRKNAHGKSQALPTLLPNFFQTDAGNAYEIIRSSKTDNNKSNNNNRNNNNTRLRCRQNFSWEIENHRKSLYKNLLLSIGWAIYNTHTHTHTLTLIEHTYLYQHTHLKLFCTPDKIKSKNTLSISKIGSKKMFLNVDFGR